MSAFFRGVSLVLGLVVIHGCGAADGRKTERPGADTSSRRPPGALCRADVECIVGSRCQYGVCEYPGPCSATVTDDSGVVVGAAVYAYDHRLRTTEARHYRKGQLDRRERHRWSADGRVQTWSSWITGAKGLLRGRMTYDERGVIRESVEFDRDAGDQTTTFEMKPGCPGVDGITRNAEGAVVFEMVSHCEGARLARMESVMMVDGKRTPFRTRVSTHQGDRLVKLEFRYRNADLPDHEIVFVRDEQGAQVGMKSRTHGHPQSVVHERWDMSCWKVTDAGITGGVGAARRGLPRPSLSAPTPLGERTPGDIRRDTGRRRP